VNVDDYRLRVEGESVREPLELTYQQLRDMPSHSILSIVECAGNQRSLFEKVLGEGAEGGQWTYGAVGNASWTGVRLRDVLELAGVRSDAIDVNLMGLDVGGAPEGGFNKPMSIEKAMNPDTIVRTDNHFCDSSHNGNSICPAAICSANPAAVHANRDRFGYTSKPDGRTINSHRDRSSPTTKSDNRIVNSRYGCSSARESDTRVVTFDRYHCSATGESDSPISNLHS
jgi:hypothetical protein